MDILLGFRRENKSNKLKNQSQYLYKTLPTYFFKSTDKMLQQIGQDMTMTEQQLKIHKSQTRKTVQLKRVSLKIFLKILGFEKNEKFGFITRYCQNIKLLTKEMYIKLLR